MKKEKITLQNVKGIGDKIAQKIINGVGGEEELQKIIEEKRIALEVAPKGRLRCKKNHNRQEYYWVTGREDTSGRYLLANEEDLVKSLAQKAYDQKALEFAEGEYKRICAL